MQFYKDFGNVTASLNGRVTRPRVAVVWPHDEHTCEAIATALDTLNVSFVLLGDPTKMDFSAGEKVKIIATPDADAAAAKAVAMAREGSADVIMKGLINTDNLLRAILNKENGILPAGHILTHITATEIPGRERLLLFSDAAVIPYPNEAQHEAITAYLVNICHRIGIEEPRIALIHCTEKISPKFPVTESYTAIKERAAAGVFGRAIVDGPMDLKTAVDPESGRLKGINSPIDGNADALVFPDIEAGNVFYKTISWLTHSNNGGMLAGAAVPVVLPSRSDSSRSKLCSLALACAVAQ